jgi:hypothetical protein
MEHLTQLIDLPWYPSHLNHLKRQCWRCTFYHSITDKHSASGCNADAAHALLAAAWPGDGALAGSGVDGVDGGYLEWGFWEYLSQGSI